MTEKENLIEKHRRRQTIRIEKRDRKKIQRIEKRKDRRKRKIIIDLQVFETDGMFPCRTEHTSSS